MKVIFKQSGDFSKTTRWLERAKENFHVGILDKYGKKGVEALAKNTPLDTGLLASSWYYTINQEPGKATLTFSNSDIEGGLPVAILVQYGHGTKSGAFVQGQDYINPALQPIIDELLIELWKEVK